MPLTPTRPRDCPGVEDCSVRFGTGVPGGAPPFHTAVLDVPTLGGLPLRLMQRALVRRPAPEASTHVYAWAVDVRDLADTLQASADPPG